VRPNTQGLRTAQAATDFWSEFGLVRKYYSERYNTAHRMDAIRNVELLVCEVEVVINRSFADEQSVSRLLA